jgi:hypothetical protein
VLREDESGLGKKVQELVQTTVTATDARELIGRVGCVTLCSAVYSCAAPAASVMPPYRMIFDPVQAIDGKTEYTAKGLG